MIGAVPERLVHGDQSRPLLPSSLAPPGLAVGFSAATLIQGSTIQGVPKNFARIRLTQNPYSGYIYLMCRVFAHRILSVLSEVMERKTIESNCFVIILCYQRTVSLLIETILLVYACCC